MFMTMDDFKIPSDAGPGQTLWSSLNMVAVSAVLIVTMRRYGHDYNSALLLANDQQLLELIRSPVGYAVQACPRRSNFDPPCRLNFDPGLVAGIA